MLQMPMLLPLIATRALPASPQYSPQELRISQWLGSAVPVV
jgi:hypothetical protein